MQTMKCIAVIAAFAMLVSTVKAGSSRALLQSALPPGSSFGGPQQTVNSSVQTPPGTVVKINWRGVGTQNYSSGSNSQYQAAGATASFYLQTLPATFVGQHFFIPDGSGGISPVFTRLNASTGQEIGRVVGKSLATSPTPNTNDDGGYGSVPNVLLQAVSATGFFDGVTFVTRSNVTGGVVPGNPKLFTLPASPQGVPNALLAVPYQADYKFWVSGSTPPSG